MATWSEISQLVAASNIDIVRRAKLAELTAITGRPTILYAAEIFNPQKVQAAGGANGIDWSDKIGFREALRSISGPNVDVVIHSLGGSPEATESIVKLLRTKFSNIRFLIPSIAKSAATMLAMSGEEIILGDEAELGPTDPQIFMNGRYNAAHSIIEQFEKAKKELAGNNAILTAWLPILQQYGPSLLISCKNAIKLTQILVGNWLSDFMFQGETSSRQRAIGISKFLGGKTHLSHSRIITAEELNRRGVKIKRAHQCTPNLSVILSDIDIVLAQTFLSTGAYKIFENNLGKGFYRTVQVAGIPTAIPPRAPQR